MTTDDERWFEALAGRRTADADPATLIEATLLREASRRWPVAMPSVMPEVSPQDLIARARAEAGLASRRAGWCAGCAQRWQRWRDAAAGPWLPVTGLAVGLAALALVLVLDVEPNGANPVDNGQPALRGDASQGPWLLRDADALGRRNRIAMDIEAAGVPVHRYERLGRFGLEADIPAALTPALQAVLERHAIRPGSTGVLQVEVEPVRP